MKKVNCKCEHKEQDKLHGKGVRVANETTKARGTSRVYRCTVCGAEHS